MFLDIFTERKRAEELCVPWGYVILKILEGVCCAESGRRAAR